MRTLRFALAGLAALISILWLAFLFLSEIPSGAYKVMLASGADGGDLVEVRPFLPLLTFWSASSGQADTRVLVPVARKIIPLDRSLPVVRYSAAENGQIMVTPSVTEPAGQAILVPVSREEQSKMRAEMQQVAAAHQARIQRLTTATLTPTWSAPLAHGAFSVQLPDDLGLWVSDSNSADDEISIAARDLPSISGLGLRIVMGGDADVLNYYRKQNPQAEKISDDMWGVVSADDRMGFLLKLPHLPDTYAIATARDEAEAVRLAAAARSVTAGTAPYEMKSGQYLGEDRPADPELLAAIEKALDPTDLLSQLKRPRIIGVQTDLDVTEPPRASVTVQTGFLPVGQRYADTEDRLRAEASDGDLRVLTDDSAPACVADFYQPLGKPGKNGQLVLVLTGGSNSLPVCRDLAGMFSGLDIGSVPDAELAGRLTDHVGAYEQVSLTEEGIRASRADLTTMFDQQGNPSLSMPGEVLFPVADGYVIRLNGKQGIVDANGGIRVDAEYDEIAQVDHMERLPNAVAVIRDGSHGLIDAVNGQIILPAEYDAIDPIEDDALLLARSGDSFKVYDLATQTLLPDMFTDFLIGEPARAGRSDDDFVALQNQDGTWIFWTRGPQPLLEGRFRDVQLETGPVTRNFHVTRNDGSQFRMDSFLTILP